MATNGGHGDVRAASDKVKAKGSMDIHGDAEIIKSGDEMSFFDAMVRGQDGEVRSEGLVDRERIRDKRREGEVDGGVCGFDEVRVDIFRLVSIVKDKVLEEGVGGERGGEKVLGEEGGWVW